MTRPLTPGPSAGTDTGTVVVVVVEGAMVGTVVGAPVCGADGGAIVVVGDPTAATGVGLDESQAASDTDAMTTKSMIVKRLSTSGWTNPTLELVPLARARRWRVIACSRARE